MNFLQIPSGAHSRWMVSVVAVRSVSVALEDVQADYNQAQYGLRFAVGD